VSAVFENSKLLVGASGTVFGFMGFFVADLIINFESIAWPFVRAFAIILILIFFVVNAIVENSRQGGQVSHASHIGGLICGIFPSLLFLPNLKDKRLAAVRREMQAQGTGATTQRCAYLHLSPLHVVRVSGCAWLYI
jgi:membrane associated rhomboid family serine protease